MSETPSSEDEVKKLAELGRKIREKRKKDASQYRKKLKEEGIDSSILRIKKKDLDKIRAMAEAERKTINGMLVRVIEQGLRWRREILESYVRGEIRQERAVGILELGHPSELSQLLALEGLPIPM